MLTAGGLGSLASAVTDALGLGSPTLTFKDNLLTFLPRVTGANLTAEVEVRFWDPDQAQAVTATKPVRSSTATLPKKPDGKGQPGAQQRRPGPGQQRPAPKKK